jgi:hypothetical protein
MKITIRQAEPKDAQQFLEFVTSTPNNLFDPDTVNYPSLQTLAVEKDGETISYVPFHPVIVVESLAHKPGVTPREHVLGLLQVDAVLAEIAKKYGIAEVWYECADQRFVKFAKRHGYKAVKTTVLRKKVGR